ncbi:hypothetical protein [Demequina sp. SO4-18]|uniref:hypothetical protein n=1 Tax=Demequina sp. SO4-18 TaxID=3401026 RepID=UPI003B5C24D4
MHAPAVIAIGDSITLGVGDGIKDESGDVGWAAHTARTLGATALFLNLAANGTRVGSGLGPVARAQRAAVGDASQPGPGTPGGAGGRPGDTQRPPVPHAWRGERVTQRAGGLAVENC